MSFIYHHFRARPIFGSYFPIPDVPTWTTRPTLTDTPAILPNFSWHRRIVTSKAILISRLRLSLYENLASPVLVLKSTGISVISAVVTTDMTHSSLRTLRVLLLGGNVCNSFRSSLPHIMFIFVVSHVRLNKWCYCYYSMNNQDVEILQTVLRRLDYQNHICMRDDKNRVEELAYPADLSFRYAWNSWDYSEILYCCCSIYRAELYLIAGFHKDSKLYSVSEQQQESSHKYASGEELISQWEWLISQLVT